MIFDDIIQKFDIQEELVIIGKTTAEICKKQEKRDTLILLFLFLIMISIYFKFFYTLPLICVGSTILFFVIRKRILDSYAKKAGVLIDSYYEKCEIYENIAFYCYYLSNKKPIHHLLYINLISILYQFNEIGYVDEVIAIYKSRKGMPEYEPYLVLNDIYRAYLKKDENKMRFLYENISYKKIDKKGGDYKKSVDKFTKILFQLLELEKDPSLKDIDIEINTPMLKVLVSYGMANILLKKGEYKQALSKFEYVIQNGNELPCVEKSKLQREMIHNV